MWKDVGETGLRLRLSDEMVSLQRGEMVDSRGK